MAALNLNRAVVTRRGACRPIPKNGLPYSAPNDVDSVDSGAVDAPNDVNSLVAESIDAPNDVSSVSGSTIDAPNNVNSLAADGINSPNEVSARQSQSVGAPVELPFISGSEIESPNAVSAKSESSVSTPNTVNALSGDSVDTPNDVSSVDDAEVAAPNVISTVAQSFSPPFPLKNPRILYETVTSGASVSATSGSNPNYSVTPNTWERWIFDGSQSITITFASNKLIDSVGIGAAQLAGKTVLVEYSTTTTGAFIEMQTQAGKNGSMLFLTDGYTGYQGYTARRVRITCTGAGTGSIGVIYAGVALQVSQAIYGGVSPIPLSRVTQYSNSRTESGEWIGRSIKSQGYTGQLKFDKLFADWYREYFDPFVVAAIEKPFFFSWRPSEYPEDAVYCWTTGDIKPSNNGGGGTRVSVSFSVEAHG